MDLNKKASNDINKLNIYNIHVLSFLQSLQPYLSLMVFLSSVPKQTPFAVEDLEMRSSRKRYGAKVFFFC